MLRRHALFSHHFANLSLHVQHTSSVSESCLTFSLSWTELLSHISSPEFALSSVMSMPHLSQVMISRVVLKGTVLSAFCAPVGAGLVGLTRTCEALRHTPS